MAKVKLEKIDYSVREMIVGRVFAILSNLKTRQEIINFLGGLLTDSEKLMIARRVQIAERLLFGMSYDDIRKELKISFNTIAKVDIWLNGAGAQYRSWISQKLARNFQGEMAEKNLLDKYIHHKIIKRLII